MMEKLWGENYFDAATKKWTTQRPDNGGERSFVMFVLKPIYQAS